MNCLAGIKPDDVSEDKARETLIANLKYGASELSRSGVKLIIESINTIDIPGFFINRTEQAKAIIKDVGSDNLFLPVSYTHLRAHET